MVKLALKSTTDTVAHYVRSGSAIENYQAEIDSYYEKMKEFQGSQPDEIFMKLAGWSARVSEIRTQLVRQESRQSQAFRTREIDPFLNEIDRQFRFWSRTQSVREFDLKLAGQVI